MYTVLFLSECNITPTERSVSFSDSQGLNQWFGVMLHAAIGNIRQHGFLICPHSTRTEASHLQKCFFG